MNTPIGVIKVDDIISFDGAWTTVIAVQPRPYPRSTAGIYLLLEAQAAGEASRQWVHYDQADSVDVYEPEQIIDGP